MKIKILSVMFTSITFGIMIYHLWWYSVLIFIVNLLLMIFIITQNNKK